MTLTELYNKYHGFSTAHDSKSKSRSKGYLDLINLYKTKCNPLESEPVMISMLAEEYIKTQEMLYAQLHKDEYRQRVLAARECLIKYASTDEISIILSGIKTDDTSMTNYLNYLKGTRFMDRIKYEDFVSAYNLLVL